MQTRPQPPLPPPDLIYRVAGTSDAGWFVKSGSQSVLDIQFALSCVGRSLAEHHKILDFGCGCGRILLQMASQVPLSSITGVDIDQEAISWLKDNVPDVTAVVVDGLPPMPFDPGTFDLVYCHSVFTHLDANYQDRWLEELARVAKVGSVLVVSFSGTKPFQQLVSQWVSANADPEPLRSQLKDSGILFITDDGWVNGPFPAFYHSTFHTVDYVKRHWGKYFKILYHLPCGSLNYQDFIVMERVDLAAPVEQNTGPDKERRSNAIPMPPPHLRHLVGPTEDRYYDNPSGKFIFPEVPPENYAAVFDFASGCGRQARQLMQQKTPPARYVGIDIHREMVAWCQANLTPVNPNFQFLHHNVYNPGLAPDNSRDLVAPFPVNSGEFTLVNAHSVFTHIFDHQTQFYLREIERVLTPNGIARTTWFFFDRAGFPWLQDGQNCLFVNADDPTNAVIYDLAWFLKAIEEVGLAVRQTVLPSAPGHQWEIFLERRMPNSVDRFPSAVEAADWICGAVPPRRDNLLRDIEELRDTNAVLTDVSGHLHAEIDLLRKDRDDLHDSLSWRITAPLRWLARRFLSR